METPEFNSKEAASLGGKARALALSKEERSESASRAASARWEKDSGPLPKATHVGQLSIGDMVLDCAVLEDKTRVISQTELMDAMKIYYSGWLSTRRKASDDASAVQPYYFPFAKLKPFIDKHLGAMQLAPLKYRTRTGNTAFGIRAELLPKICFVWQDALAAGVLKGSRQKIIAAQADMLIRGLAGVAIIALVDEATGYQYDRPRRDLEEYLKRFISDSLRRWVRTFPSDYFKHLCRLRGVDLRPDMKLPQYFGTLTNNLIYRRLAPGLLKKLKEQRQTKGSPGNKLHSWLSQDTGFPEVLVHLGQVVGLMKIHTDYGAFEKELDRIAPIYDKTPGLFDDPADWADRDGPKALPSPS